jgi:hypothetical protein
MLAVIGREEKDIVLYGGKRGKHTSAEKYPAIVR